jgi:glycosyltransferase involved in cell wall biosynthesis
MPSVSFLVPTLGSPVLGPVTVLGRILARHLPVQIVGPDLGDGVCAMYRGAFDYTVVPAPRMYRVPEYWRDARRLAAAVTGDIVVAVKATAQTLPVAWRVRRDRGAKVVAYLDEWDGALTARLTPAQRAARWLRHWQHPGDEVYIPRWERRIAACDAVVSTTTFLQRRFGGRIIQMGVDPDDFAPRPAEEIAATRAALGLHDHRVVVFGGVVRPHKGIELILEALARLADPRALLLIIGPENEHVRALAAQPRFAPHLRCLGAQPRERMPALLGIGEVTVQPLRDDPLAQSQMPCKVFEAMAMALPVIASSVADLPRVLAGGCGWVVPPDDPAALAERLAWVFAHPEAARETGLRARARCVERYSRSVTEKQLLALVHELGTARS